MAEVDYMVLCDYVRPEGGLAHMVAAGIDQFTLPAVPTGHQIGIAVRLMFTRQECDRAHKVELIFQDEDGERVWALTAQVVPIASTMAGRHGGALLALNPVLPILKYGTFSLELLVDDSEKKTITVYVVPPVSA